MLDTTNKPLETLNESNRRFQHIFRLLNAMWLTITIISVASNAYFLIHDKPAYLSDWHGPAIVVLSLIAIVFYASVFFRPKLDCWPPSLKRSLTTWLGMYLGVVGLNLIDQRFWGCLFAVFGLAFALFEKRTLLAIATLMFVTLSAFLGTFSPPFTLAHLGDQISWWIGFWAFTFFMMNYQYLISERFMRNRLIHELAEANTKLEEAHRQLAASAIQEQELAVLRERTRVAREMHDTLGHALVLVTVKLEAAQRLRERDPQRCDRELDETKEIVRTSMTELRASIANLRSPVLEQEPLHCALRRSAHEMAQRAGWQLTYDVSPPPVTLPAAVEETLWKVAQEALTNIEKHAHAHNVVLALHCHNDQLHLRIQDDGIGLSPELYSKVASPPNHFGLSGMAERVANMHGTISLQPASPHGTIVAVELPLTAQLSTPLA